MIPGACFNRNDAHQENGLSILDSIFKVLNPPRIGATEDQLYLWRLWMVFMVGTIGLVLTIHIVWASGRLPWFEDGGFAMNDKFTELRDEIRANRKNTLVRDILDLRKNQCLAKGELKEIYTRELVELQEVYKKLNGGVSINIPSCSDYG